MKHGKEWMLSTESFDVFQALVICIFPASRLYIADNRPAWRRQKVPGNRNMSWNYRTFMLDFCKVKAAKNIVNEGDLELNSRRESGAYCYCDTSRVGEIVVACFVANTLLVRLRLYGRLREARYPFRIIHRLESLEFGRDQTQVHSSACLESQAYL
jgi:hypothetical protein